MQSRISLVGAFIALAMTACSPSASDDNTVSAPTAPTEQIAGVEQPDAPITDTDKIVGVGVITALDAEAGRLGLRHEPILALNWSAMTMMFQADPVLLTDLTIGDPVSFEIKSTEESQTIIRINRD